MNDKFPESVADMPDEFSHIDWSAEDWDALFALRKWLQEALEKSGAKVTDSGAGIGRADVGISMGGKAYSVSIAERRQEQTGSMH